MGCVILTSALFVFVVLWLIARRMGQSVEAAGVSEGRF